MKIDKQGNQMHDLPLGAKKDPKDKRDYRIKGIMAIGEPVKEKILLPNKFPSNNQFSRGSCTSQAQAHHKERQEEIEVSARFIMAKTKEYEGNKEYGAYTRNTFKIVKEFGAAEQRFMPEPPASMSWDDYINATVITGDTYANAEQHKSQSYWRVDVNTEELKNVLKQFGNSVVISMAWYSEFNRPDSQGILPRTYSNYAGGHAVEVVGLNDFDELMTCKNSWGPEWGQNGFFKIPYAMLKDIVWDAWTSLDMPADLPVDLYYGQKRTWISFLREQKVAFNPWLINRLGRLPNNREIKGLAYGFWEYEAVFEGKYGDLWLHMTKPEAIKNNKI